MTVGADADGRSRQRSFTVHGDEEWAAERQAELVNTYGVRRALPAWEGERFTVGKLQVLFVAAPQAWSPTTLVSHSHMASKLRRDGLSRCRLDRLTPAIVQTAISRWADKGASVSVISGRYAVLHAAISWGIAERLLRFDPLAGMHAPPRPYPRKHLPPELVRRLIGTAEQRREKAAAMLAEQPASWGAQLRLFRADQDVLLVRLVADAGLRRGELVGLRTDDLDGRVLLIERASKGRVVGPTKTHQRCRITLGATVSQLWANHLAIWQTFPPAEVETGPWLFTTNPTRAMPLTPSGLRQRFDKIVKMAEVPGACPASDPAYRRHLPRWPRQDPQSRRPTTAPRSIHHPAQLRRRRTPRRRRRRRPPRHALPQPINHRPARPARPERRNPTRLVEIVEWQLLSRKDPFASS